MNCERHNRNLSALLDGRLGRREEARLRHHLADCRRCASDLEEIKRSRDLLRALPDPEPSPDFWKETYRSIRTVQMTQRRRRTRMAGRYAVYTALALVLAAAVLIPRSPEIRIPPIRRTAVTTLNPDALVALLASFETEIPLADSGSLGYAHTSGIASDWANDHQLDIQ